jgi:hypothetical protein
MTDTKTPILWDALLGNIESSQNLNPGDQAFVKFNGMLGVLL